jgi:hypothetical protein
MPKIVEIPGVGNVEFPDEMGDEQIAQIAAREAANAAPPPTPVKELLSRANAAAPPPSSADQRPLVPSLGDLAATAGGVLTGGAKAAGSMVSNLDEMQNLASPAGILRKLATGRASSGNSMAGLDALLAKMQGVPVDAATALQPQGVPEKVGSVATKIGTALAGGIASAPMMAAVPLAAAPVVGAATGGVSAGIQGDSPIEGAAFGGVGAGLGAAAGAVRSLRAASQGAAGARELTGLASAPTNIEAANKVLGVTKATLKGGYKPAEALLDEGIDLSAPRTVIRDAVKASLDKLRETKNGLLGANRPAGTSADIRKASQALDAELAELRTMGDPLAKQVRKIQQSLTGIADRAEQLGRPVKPIEMDKVIQQLDRWISRSKGEIKAPIKNVLIGVRRQLNETLTAGDDALKATNAKLRDLGRARRALDDAILKEEAGQGARAVAPPPPAGLDMRGILGDLTTATIGGGRVSALARLASRFTR